MLTRLRVLLLAALCAQSSVCHVAARSVNDALQTSLRGDPVAASSQCLELREKCGGPAQPRCCAGLQCLPWGNEGDKCQHIHVIGEQSAGPGLRQAAVDSSPQCLEVRKKCGGPAEPRCCAGLQCLPWGSGGDKCQHIHLPHEHGAEDSGPY